MWFSAGTRSADPAADADRCGQVHGPEGAAQPHHACAGGHGGVGRGRGGHRAGSRAHMAGPLRVGPRHPQAVAGLHAEVQGHQGTPLPVSPICLFFLFVGIPAYSPVLFVFSRICHVCIDCMTPQASLMVEIWMGPPFALIRLTFLLTVPWYKYFVSTRPDSHDTSTQGQAAVPLIWVNMADDDKNLSERPK